MKELVRRLRYRAVRTLNLGDDQTMRQAADLIESQAKAIEEMRSSLSELVERMDGEYGFDGPHLERAKMLIASYSKEGEQ